MASEVESSGVPVSVSSATPTGSEEQTAVWPLDYPVSVGLLERRITEAISDIAGSGDLATKSYVESSVSSAKSSLSADFESVKAALAEEAKTARAAEGANAKAVSSLEESVMFERGTDVDGVKDPVDAVVPKDGAPQRVAVASSGAEGANVAVRRTALTPSCVDVRATATVDGRQVSTVTRYGEAGIEFGYATSAGLETHGLKVPKLSKDEVIATESGLDLKLDKSLLGEKNGVARLDENGHVPSSQLPSYVDDVLEYGSKSDFPADGESGKIYVALDTNLTYRWGGTEYVEIASSLALGETSSTAYAGDKGKELKDALDIHVGSGENPHKVTAKQVGAVSTAGDGVKSMSLSADGKLTCVVDETSGSGSVIEVTKTVDLLTETDPVFSEWKDVTSVALGGATFANHDGVAIGNEANAQGANAAPYGSVAIGSAALGFKGGVAVGHGANAQNGGVAIGRGAYVPVADAAAFVQGPDKFYFKSDEEGLQKKTLQAYLDEKADGTLLSSSRTLIGKDIGDWTFGNLSQDRTSPLDPCVMIGSGIACITANDNQPEKGLILLGQGSEIEAPQIDHAVLIGGENEIRTVADTADRSAYEIGSGWITGVILGSSNSVYAGGAYVFGRDNELRAPKTVLIGMNGYLGYESTVERDGDENIVKQNQALAFTADPAYTFFSAVKNGTPVSLQSLLDEKLNRDEPFPILVGRDFAFNDKDIETGSRVLLIGSGQTIRATSITGPAVMIGDRQSCDTGGYHGEDAAYPVGQSVMVGYGNTVVMDDAAALVGATGVTDAANPEKDPVSVVAVGANNQIYANKTATLGFENFACAPNSVVIGHGGYSRYDWSRDAEGGVHSTVAFSSAPDRTYFSALVDGVNDAGDIAVTLQSLLDAKADAVDLAALAAKVDEANEKLEGVA